MLPSMSSPERTKTPGSDYCSPTEAARLLGVGLRTLARMADRGELVAYKLPSGQRRYLRSSIEELTDTTRAAG